MVLSNAERQARYRKRLKERASHKALGERAREVACTAVQVIWDHWTRENVAFPEDFESVEDFRSSLAASEDAQWNLVALSRDSVEHDVAELSEEELAALRLVVEIDDALRLKGSE
jgi:hypothetical protein|tara:strand:- start:257 stop:601 length:345 start_codon:yes stop_codon:yes gene_type:complete